MIRNICWGWRLLSAFGSVKKAVEEKFGDQYPLHKENCIGHIQKRMGATLHNC